jgi:hypothetical protein
MSDAQPRARGRLGGYKRRSTTLDGDLLAVVRAMAGPDGRCYASDRALADAIGSVVSPDGESRTVQRGLTRLERAGHITRERERDDDGRTRRVITVPTRQPSASQTSS